MTNDTNYFKQALKQYVEETLENESLMFLDLTPLAQSYVLRKSQELKDAAKAEGK